MSGRFRRSKWRHQKEDNQPTPSALNSILEAIKFIGGITAILTLAGFIIVQSHLQLYTDLRPYNIQPIVYLTAGAIYILLFAFLILPQIKLFTYIYEKTLAALNKDDNLLQKIFMGKSSQKNFEKEKTAFGIGLIPLAVIFITCLVITFSSRGIGVLIYAGIAFISLFLIFIILISFDLIRQKTVPLWKILFNNLSVFFCTVILITATSIVYGITIYDGIVLGGGSPRIIQLIGKQESKNLRNTGVTMLDETTSISVCQIVELTDALLIFDPTTNNSLTIKESEIIGKRESKEKINCRKSYLE